MNAARRIKPAPLERQSQSEAAFRLLRLRLWQLRRDVRVHVMASPAFRTFVRGLDRVEATLAKMLARVGL